MTAAATVAPLADKTAATTRATKTKSRTKSK